MGKVLVIGGGASGLLAGITAASLGEQVTILEAEPKAAAKLLRTGNGRCNFTNAGCASGKYHGGDPSFAEAVVAAFSAEDTISLFQEMGILPHRQGNLLYPHSETAASVVDALLRRVRELGIKLKLSERAVSIERQSDGLFTVRTKTWHYEADQVILSCGTAASMKPDFLAGFSEPPLGLPMTPYHPSLCPLFVKEPGSEKWAGVRVHAAATLVIDGVSAATEEGQIQFVKKGISGIAIFNMASAAYDALSKQQRVEVRMDLAPDYDEANLLPLISGMLSRFQNFGNEKQAVERLLLGMVPEKLIPFLVRRLSELPKENAAAERIVRVLKEFSVEVVRTAELSSAQVAAGGILTDVIDPATMMVASKPGLYVTGEMLDVDGACGGWNLQFAWASGVLAGRAAAACSKQKNTNK